MHSVLKDIVISLENLNESILNSSSDDRTLTEMYGWQFPPLNRLDMANLASNLVKKISSTEINEIDENLIKELDEIPERIELFESKILPQISGNFQVAYALTTLFDWINSTLEPLYSWQVLHDNKALPNNLARKLRSIQADLDEIVPNKSELQNQISLIRAAVEAAETLPTDLASLKDARTKVDTYSTSAAELFGKIDKCHKDIETTFTNITVRKNEADKLVNQCEDAYKITTTKGLAGAFTQRAYILSNSMWIWVVGLLIALIAGACIGAHRFDVLNVAINNPQSNIGHIWIQIFLSILSLSAPIWFAWLATKQIGQRFKLSEDYAFKATVAKAYEGYRKEAARIDESFEARLFSSALTRLEEAPLRLMEQDHHGSPWHELISSPQFQKAFDTIPELKDKVIEITKNSVEKIIAPKNAKKDSLDE